MSKFCKNCGTEMAEDETICKVCNTNNAEEVKAEPVKEEKVEEAPKDTANTTSAPQKMSTKTLAIIGGGIAAAVVVLIIIISSIVSGRYKAPIKNMIKGYNKCDSKVYLKAYPDFLNMDKNIDDSYLKDSKKDDEKDYGDNVKYGVKFLKKTKIDKDDLKYVENYIKDKYDEKVKVKKGFIVKVERSIKGKEDYDYSTGDMYVYKIDGKWYILPVSPETARKASK